MSSNLTAYLAKNYLTASTPSSHPGEPPKKKRKKHKSHPQSSSLIIADDDDDLGLSATNTNTRDDVDTDAPIIFEGKVRSAEFRKAKQNTWRSLETQTADTNDTDTRPTPAAADDDAATLLRTAQSEDQRRLTSLAAENAPTIVETSSPPRMSSGAPAGLQTAADTARLLAAQQLPSSSHKKPKPHNSSAPEEETIYRDATGRRIDLSQRRAEARREAALKQEQDRRDRLSALGEVQLREREERKHELDNAKFLSLGRGVEDDEYNDRLKGVVRWDDPMAGYMAEKQREEETKEGGTGKRGKKVGRAGGDVGRRTREYLGAAAPNRYGIRPGWRWDGVDRGNGFEREWFQARSRRSRNEALSYEWQMDE